MSTRKRSISRPNSASDASAIVPPASCLTVARRSAEGGEEGDGFDLVVGEFVPADVGRWAAGMRRAAVEEGVGRDEEVEAYVVGGGGDAGADLELVDRGDHDGGGGDQAGFGGHRELEVGEAAALAEPGAVRAGGHRAGDDEVDRV